MYKTALEHAVIALIIQLVLWPVFGIVAAGAIAVAIFVGREIAQHEYKGGGPNEVPWYYGLIKEWNMDSILDIVLPLIGCSVLAAVVRLL